MKELFLVLAAMFMWPSISFANGNDRHMGDWGHMMAGGMFVWIVFPILAVLVVLLILQSTRSTSFHGSSRETSIDILRKRYAKGEIAKDDFEKMKRDLES